MGGPRGGRGRGLVSPRTPAAGRRAAQNCTLFTAALFKELLRKVAKIPASVDFHAFGRIYMYFQCPICVTGGPSAVKLVVCQS